MARRIFTVPTWTPTAVGDTANFTDAGHMSIKGGSSTQLTEILEVFLGGLATASAPTIMQLARHSTVTTTPAALSGANTDAAMDPATAALGAVVLPFVAITTVQPQASATLKLGSFAFNAFGGLVRNKWNPSEGPKMLGNTASLGELGLNAFTGGTPGLMGGHIIYETA